MIDFGSPFDRALRRTGAILFQPFRLKRWLVLGFITWMVACFQGAFSYNNSLSNNSFNFNSTFHNGTTAHSSATSHASVSIPPTTGNSILGFPFSWEALWGMWGGAILFGTVFALIAMVVVVWLSARGQFMFLDNVVQNRHAVREPWHAFRRRGNSLCLALFVMIFATLPLIFLPLLAFAGSFAALKDSISAGVSTAAAAVAAILVLLWLILLLAWLIACFLYMEFAVPIMYCTGCMAREAARRVKRLILEHPGDMLIYVTIRIGMAIAFLFITLVILFSTCCIGGLPYVSSVLTLPLPVFRQCYTLGCLGQLDPEYDIWKLLQQPPPLSPAPPSGTPGPF